jgi:Heparinase II/III-like protein/Heparinase II/III N-terminus
VLHNADSYAMAGNLTLRTTPATLASIVTRVRGRSLDELRVRASQALHARLEWVSDSWTGPRRTPGKERCAGPIFDRGVEALAGKGVSPEGIARAIAGLDRQISAKLAEQSNAAEGGVVTLLGHGPLSVGNPPRWHVEAVSGKEAPSRHWSRIDHLDIAAVGDHKVLWELNRHQYLLAPAFCWLLEGESRRFDLIQSHLTSWLGDNPARRGVNWVSSLELSLRAITWCWLLWMLREAPWKPELRTRLVASLEAHGRQIERYLSIYFSPNTHLTGEALGLFYLGTVLRCSRHADRWRTKGAAILESALARQVYPDGVYFEQASQYQRYTAEIYLHYVLLATATGWSVPDATRDSVANLLTVLRSMISGRGCMPLLGDDDGGLLLPLDHRPPDDLRALLLAGAVALNRPELIAPGEASPAYAYWLCGIERTDRMLAKNGVDPRWLDMYFSHGGLAVLRDGWDPTAAVSVIDAGPHGALGCGHSHADALALTIALGPTELFIDRGTLTYTGAERNEFRSTASHNTLEIDGASSVTPGEAFKWLCGFPPRAQGVVYSSTHFSGFGGLAAGHVGSARPSVHRRRVLHRRRGAWVIHDQGVRHGARGGTLRWQLAAGLVAESLTAQSVGIRNHAGIGIATVFMFGSSAPRIVTRDVSSRLGHRTPAQCLELPVDASLEAITVIVPATPDGRLAAIAHDGQRASTCVTWADDGGRQRLRCGPPPLGAAGLPAHLLANADLLWFVDRSPESARESMRCDLLAAMKADPLPVPDVAQLVTDLREQSGKMTVLEDTDGAWRAVRIEEPRRGQRPG